MNVSRLFAVMAFAVANGLFSTPGFAVTSPVGATPGQFRVTESGAASYNIPITLPPGTAGMQPTLSIDYNSQGGNGLLGVGWSLNGLSAIARCPQTQAQDGVRGSVNYDNNDRYCMEGQRLIAISGAYGANGTEYRTEIESYNRIISYGTAGNGPAYFKVWSKSGQVMEYGVTNDSRIEAQGKSTVAVWALNKVQDTVGNYLTVTYTEDNANGQYYPARIDYTGNAGTGLTPYNAVQFTYEARPDVTPMYHAGSVMKNTVRLKNVTSFAGTALVKEYRLIYEQGFATILSRLLNVSECGGDDVCMAPTVFNYQEPGAGSLLAKELGLFSSWVNEHSPVKQFQLEGTRISALLWDGRLQVKDGSLYAGWTVVESNVSNFQLSGNRIGVLKNGSLQVKEGTLDASWVIVETGVENFQLSGNRIGVLKNGAVQVKEGALDASWVIVETGVENFQLAGDRIGVLKSGAVRVKEGSLYGSWVVVETGAESFQLSGNRIGVLKNGTLQVKEGSLYASWVIEASGVDNFQLVGNRIGYQDGKVLRVKEGPLDASWVIVATDVELYRLSGDNTAPPDRIGYIVSGAQPDLLTTITNGLGAVTTITYKPLTDSTVYTKDNNSTYPTVDVQAPMYVVASSSASDGIGGNYQMSYRYGGLKAMQDGRGSLGFRTMETTDTQTGIITRNEYRQDYPYIGAASLSTKTVNGILLNQAQNSYIATPLGGTRYDVKLAQTVESSYELNGALVTTMTTTNQYDAYGNPTQIVTSTGDGYTKTTNNTYTNDTTNWYLGRLTQATVSSATPNAGTLTRTSSFAYNPANGLLTQEVVEPNNSALRLQTDYTYDGYGNKISVTVSGVGITTRTTTTTFDSRGQFPVTTTNALNQSDNGSYDARFGKPASLTGPNALTTTWSYDGFGRKVNETRADGTQTSMIYYPCDGTCPSLAKYYVSSVTTGAPTSTAYFDSLSREVRMAVQGFDGRLIIKDTYYDSLGRVDRVTKPYYSGDSPLFYRNQYDILGRVLVETAPDNSTKSMSYNGLVTSMTNALNQVETKTKNSQGQLVRVTDHFNNSINYLYDPFGNLLQTTDPKGNVTTLSYDLRGRKIAMADPDMGNWSYQYNVLGELISQTDAKNQVVTMSYDKLGRILSRNEPDLISTWVYDTAVKGVGKLTQSSSDNGSKRVYSYDSFGRVATETSTIDTTYTVSKTYDAFGRVSVLTYPTGVAFKNIYNAYGYLAEVRNNATNALFWQANAKDADGHVINETLGNGLTTQRSYNVATSRVASIKVGPNSTASIQNQTFVFDTLGNLIYRYDPLQGQSEAFAYDGLNRLTAATQGATTVTVTYDSIGNISNKSDVGAYTYGARPHAVTAVAGALNANYTYDANGNLTSGAGRSVTLTSFNLPSQITQAGKTVNFLYDADHMRIRQVSATETTFYLNPRIDQGMHFEKEVKGSVTEYKHYIYGAAGVVGVYTTSSVASPKTSYFHQDHLGSIVAVTDDSAAVVARFAFDPWGKRILLAGDDHATHHGFTGHEHLDMVGLVHMNGRIYDPILARFMSADPYIQSPDNLQSYNRYSYVWNNPLSATDPSGYFKLKKIFKALVNPAQTILKNVSYSTGQILVGIGSIFCGPAYAACAAAGSYDNAKAHGLSTGEALGIGIRAGVTAYIAGKVNGYIGDKFAGFENVAAHAAFGCVQSLIGGGSCGSGAVGGAISAGLAEYGGLKGVPKTFEEFSYKLALSTVAGGLAAQITGGNFANGAVTAAFAYAYNAAGDHGGSDPNTVGARGVAEVMAQYRAAGYDVLGVEVSASLPGFDFTRRYDFVTRDLETGQYIGVEVKASEIGLFRLDRKQVSFDSAVLTLPGGATVARQSYRITAIRYEGVGFSATINARFQQGYLQRQLNSVGIEPKVTRAP